MIFNMNDAEISVYERLMDCIADEQCPICENKIRNAKVLHCTTFNQHEWYIECYCSNSCKCVFNEDDLIKADRYSREIGYKITWERYPV